MDSDDVSQAVPWCDTVTPASQGYLTMAVGRRSYLELAVDMALSLKEHTRLPVALATDERLASVVAGSFPAVFDHVGLLPGRFRVGRARKYGAAEASPFDETVFLDADCVVLGSLDATFDVLGSEPLAMLGEHLTQESGDKHHGFPIRTLLTEFRIETYLKTNSGIFAFRRADALPILEECLETYVGEVRPRLRWPAFRGGWLGDEIAFGIVGGRRKVGVLPPPGPMFWPNEFASIDLARPGRPLLHLIHKLPHGTFEALVDGVRARRARAGLPDDDPRHLRREMGKLGKPNSIMKLARRLGLRLALTAAAVGAASVPAMGQEDTGAVLARADSLYFAGKPEESLELLRSGALAVARPSDTRWRTMRATVALGMEPGTTAQQNQWLDQGVALAREAKEQGPPTVDELFWGAAAEGRRALNAGPRYAGELGVRARDDARLVLVVDSLHGGAHNVLGRVGLEVMSLSRIQRILARATGTTFPGDTNWEEAEYHLRRAAELWPQMVLYHLDLAKLLIKRKRGDEARAALERALATPLLHPPDTALKEEARALLSSLGSGDGV